MLQEEDNNIDLGEFGLGDVRSHRDYELYSGIDFKKRRLHPETLKGTDPPINDDSNWFETKLNKFTYNIVVPRIEAPEDNYDFWAVSFLDEFGGEIFREDASEDELKTCYSVKSDYVQIKRTFMVDDSAKSWSIWLHHKENGWIKQITGEI